jgi:hypothetical protein
MALDHLARQHGATLRAERAGHADLLSWVAIRPTRPAALARPSLSLPAESTCSHCYPYATVCVPSR